MPRRFLDEPPPTQNVASPAFTKLLFMAFGIAALSGLVCGLVWVAWHLLKHMLA